MNTLDEVVSDLSEKLSGAERRLNEAWWEMALTSSDTARAEKTQAEIDLREILADPAAFEVLGSAEASQVGDPLLARAARRLYLSALPEQVSQDLRAQIVEMSTAIEARFNAYRATVDGDEVTDNEIDSVLRHSDDTAERRAYWEASKQVGAEVATDVRKLAALRNEAATQLGYPSFRSLALATQEFDPTWLSALLGEVDHITKEAFARWKQQLEGMLRERFGVHELLPWHYGDRFFQESPSEGGVDLDPVFADADLEGITARTFSEMGLPIETALARSDLRPRPGKSQHAFCLHVDRLEDVRVLSNNEPSERWMSTMLHEFGHAAYDLAIDRSLPFALREPAHTFTTEGAAMLLGRLVYDASWLTRYGGVPEPQAQTLAARAASARRGALLVFARWGLVMARFEEALYADPGRSDLDTLWWDLVESIQLVSRPPGRAAPDWAAKIHVAVAPVYYHNYVIGELFASQIAHTVDALSHNLEAGRWLTERVFAPGARMRWDELCRSAFGAPLSPAAWGDDLD
jgi:peptidyl-dipeptidase A